MENGSNNTESGAQRHSIPRLKAWEALGRGMFIHFGMSTFDQDEYSKGDRPSTLYAPDRLDVDQWVNVARDAGMSYAVLTTKHVAGHCLWPSRHTDYHVGTSGNRTDVVEWFVRACRRAGIVPGLYYCSWDNHHLFGSVTPNYSASGPHKDGWNFPWAFTTRRYQDFQYAQLEELATAYGEIGEFWIDIPGVLPHGYRAELYQRLAELQPETMVLMNRGLDDGRTLTRDFWPSDAMIIETCLPQAFAGPGQMPLGHQPWREILGERHYLPAEVCDTVNRHWFCLDGDSTKPDDELLGLSLLARSRGCNLMLNVGPDRHGVIPPEQVGALMRLQANRERLGML